jgi:AcrR family transcriptional regulator
MAEVIASKAYTHRYSAEVRRQQIVRVAADLFSKHGFSGTTTKEIAEHAGVSEAIIFRHFATKRDLYSAIIDSKTRPSSESTQARLEEAAAAKDDRAFFHILALEKLEMYCADPALIRLLLYSALERHELTDIFFESTALDLRNFVRTYISQRIADGAFRDVDPAVCARAFMGMVWNQAQVRILFNSCDDLEMSGSQIADAFVDMFLNGVVKERESSATS